MKIRFVVFLALTFATGAWAESTISSNTSSNSAYGANIGWLNWHGDVANGAVIGEFVCSGNIYSANVGWINLGNGQPANGIRYENNSTNDFGVNHDGVGNLSGYAYGANIGWINFETNGNPRVNLKTGVLSGYVWGANAGWISLSNALAVVKTDSIFSGADTDGDGIPDAWERLHSGNLLTLSGGGHDQDLDGLSDAQEYLADTDPLDANDKLRIMAHSVTFPEGNDLHTLTWTSRPTRFYKINFVDDFDPGFSFNSVSTLISPSEGLTTTEQISFGNSSGQRYLRIQAVRPLAP